MSVYFILLVQFFIYRTNYKSLFESRILGGYMSEKVTYYTRVLLLGAILDLLVRDKNVQITNSI